MLPLRPFAGAAPPEGDDHRSLIVVAPPVGVVAGERAQSARSVSPCGGCAGRHASRAPCGRRRWLRVDVLLDLLHPSGEFGDLNPPPFHLLREQ